MRAFAFVVVLTAAVVAGGFYAYNWEFNALKREIQKHGNLKIVKSWRNDDLILDDFGFTVSWSAGEFQINLFGDSASSIHRPSDRAAGLLMWRDDRPYGQEAVAFGDPYWKTHHLPAIENIAGFLEHSEEVLTTLATQPPDATAAVASSSGRVYRDYIQLVVKKKPGV
jgi:hypothetical protein